MRRWVSSLGNRLGKLSILLVGVLAVVIAIAWILLDIFNVDVPWLTRNLPQSILFVLGVLLIYSWQERHKALEDILDRLPGPNAFVLPTREQTYGTAANILATCTPSDPEQRKIYLSSTYSRTGQPTEMGEGTSGDPIWTHYRQEMDKRIDAKGTARWQVRHLRNIISEVQLNEYLEHIRQHEDAEDYEVSAVIVPGVPLPISLLAIGDQDVLLEIPRTQRHRTIRSAYHLRGSAFVSAAREYFDELWRAPEVFRIKPAGPVDEKEVARLRQTLRPRLEVIEGRTALFCQVSALLDEAQALQQAGIVEYPHVYLTYFGTQPVERGMVEELSFRQRLTEVTAQGWPLVYLWNLERPGKVQELQDDLADWLGQIPWVEVRYSTRPLHPPLIEFFVVEKVGGILIFPSMIEGELAEVGFCLREEKAVEAMIRHVQYLRGEATVISRRSFQDPDFFADLIGRTGKPIEVVDAGQIHALAAQIVQTAPSGASFWATGFSRDISRKDTTDEVFQPYFQQVKTRLNQEPRCEYRRAIRATTPEDVKLDLKRTEELSELANAAVRFYFDSPQFPDFLITGQAIVMGFPDPRAYQGMWAGLVIRDPEAVAIFREWYQRFVWESDVRKTDLKRGGKVGLEEEALEGVRAFSMSPKADEQVQ